MIIIRYFGLGSFYYLLKLLFIMSMFFASGAVKSSPQLFSELSALTEEDYAWIGAKIYQNEAASSPKYLTHWGKGENFPSFGIAHFIWFPNISPPPYQETFPAMFEFVSKKIPPPSGCNGSGKNQLALLIKHLMLHGTPRRNLMPHKPPVTCKHCVNGCSTHKHIKRILL